MYLRKFIICYPCITAILCGGLMAQGTPEEDIREAKPLIEIPQPGKFPVALWLWISAGVLFVVLAAVFCLWLARRKRRKSPPETALAALEELEKSSDQLVAEAFANQAARTIRQYIAEHFGIAAPRRTTEEFFRELAEDGAEPVIADSDHLKSFLKSCDLAKFAGANLDTTQRGDLLQSARGFVKATSTPNTQAVKS